MDTQNTLDQSYDEGGLGAGRTITADNGAILINGTDGFQSTGTLNSGVTLALTGPGTKMFFYPKKGAFRAGHVSSIRWDDVNIGNYSTAFGLNTEASGNSSTAFGFNVEATGAYSSAFGASTVASGSNSTAFGTSSVASGDFSSAYGLSSVASGNYSVAFGRGANAIGPHSTAMGTSSSANGDRSTAFGSGTLAMGYASTAFGGSNNAIGDYSTAFGSSNTASSFAETATGIFNNETTANSTTSFDTADQIFSIGNGINNTNRSNALTIYKSGLMNINDEYNMPLIDGTANQVITTNGAGQLSFASVGGDADWFKEGTTTVPTLITDDIYTQGHVAIGKNTADSPLDIEVTGAPANLIAIKMVDNSTGTGDHIGMQQSFGGSYSQSIKGIETNISNTGNGLHTGINTSVQNGTGDQVGAQATLRGSAGANTIFTGIINNSGSASSSTQTGLSLTVEQPSSQVSYGILNYLSATGANATGIKYGIYNLIDAGTGNHYGVYNDVRGLGSNTKYGTYNRFGIGTTNTGGVLYGTYNDFGTSITSTSDKYGNYTVIPSTLAGTHYGSFVNVLNASGYAGYFLGRFSIGTTTANNYILPASRGTNGQVMITDGAGNVTFQNPNTGTDDQNIQNLAFNTSTNILTVGIESGTSQTVDLSTLSTGGDITAVTAGTGLTGGGTTGTVTLDVIATNGLTANANDVQLGGTLSQATTIAQGNNDMIFNLTGTGDFRINDSGTQKLVVLDNGDAVLGGDLYMRDENTGGSLLARITDINGDDGALDLYNSDVLTTRINGGGDSYVTAGNLGVGTASPDYNLSVTGTLNLREDIATSGVALRVNGIEALWFDGSQFSWGFGGTNNYFADQVGIGINAPSYKLDVRDANAGDYVAQIFNTSTNANADGLKIRVGNLAVPTASTSYIAFFDGNNTVRGRIEGNGTGVTFNTTSDQRLKTNISNIDNALNLIEKIQPRRYEYKANLGTQEYGFIAQELQQLYPQAVSGAPDSDVETDPMMVDYSRLTPLLTAGIKELSEKVEALENENQKLKEELSKYKSLEERMSALENFIETNNLPQLSANKE